MIDILNRNTYIWGTGINEEIFNRELCDYSTDLQLLNISLKDQISGYIESDPNKETWREREVFKPEKALTSGMQQCIVTPKAKKGIVNWLDNNNVAWCTSEEYLDILKDYILKTVNLDKLEYHEKEHALNGAEIINYIYKWKNEKRIIENEWNCLVEERSIEYVISYLAKYYKNDISDIALELPKCNKLQVNTIGIYIDKLYGGGIEKVVEMLVWLYIEDGYTVVVITDEQNTEIEPEIYLSDKVIRYNMKIPKGANVKERLCELWKLVEENNIDIICYHYGYTRINTYYEMLYLRMKGLPVLMELHSSVATIKETPREIFSHLHEMYRLANVVVVLSLSDKDYWEKKGVPCVYIPNPIQINKAVHHCSDGKTVLWVGRLVQDPKQILDVPEIVALIKKEIPDIKLIMIGYKEREYDYRLLVDKIDKLGVAANLIIENYQPSIEDYYNKADVVLMTSNKESFSNVILESRYYGVPLVMYRIPWLELTKDKRGLVEIKQNDVEGAADEIVKLLSDNKYKTKMSKLAKDSTSVKSNEDIMERWESLFEMIL